MTTQPEALRAAQWEQEPQHPDDALSSTTQKDGVMVIEWVYNEATDTWELYVNNSCVDLLKINRASDSVLYFRGEYACNDLNLAKEFMESRYK